MYITYKNKMANLTGTPYTNLISALTADVTNSHSANLSTPDEASLASKTYYETRDYWLTVPRQTLMVH